jgi:lipooligosaccharide transport system permease protein
MSDTRTGATAPAARLRPGRAAAALRVIPVAWLPRGQFGGRGSRHLIERHVRVYGHNWLILASGFLEPLFYLLSLGVGLGRLVGNLTGADGRPITFAAFVAPALLATSAMNGAIFDSTFNVFFRLKYDKFYDAALATPMQPGDIALGEIGWALLRGALYGAAFMVVMLALGLIHSPFAVFDIGVALLIGFAFAATGMAATTFMRSWQDFEYVTLATLPMFLFSSTFYPLSVYPRPVAIFVEATPLYQGIALLRGLTLGPAGPALLWPAAYLAVLGLAGLLISARRIGRLLLT